MRPGLIAMLACGALALGAQVPTLPAPDALSRAHDMHQRLLRTPAGERTPADYEAIVTVLETVWRQPGSRDADSARFEAASIYVDEARDLRANSGGAALAQEAYAKAAREFLDLLHASPYTAYRRNAEWALAQIQIYHLHQPRAAADWLRDFEHRYPADLRVPLAHQEVLGKHIPEPAYLSPTEPPAVLPAIAPPSVAAAAPPVSTPAPAPAAEAAAPVRAPRDLKLRVGDVRGLEVFSNPDSTSVVIALRGEVPFARGAVPARHLVYFDIGTRGRPAAGRETSLSVNDGRVVSVRVAPRHDGLARVVITTASGGVHADRGRFFPNPDRLVIGVTGAAARAAGRESEPPNPPRPAAALSNGGSSLTRALGLKIARVVIDAGHGGHDTGTIGPDGLEEKNVVLDVALRLGELLRSRLGLDVVYTRRDDTFIPLEERTAIANRDHADLFVSIHANSSPDASARGVETYYLDLTNNAQALAVAARENAGSDAGIHDLPTLVRTIALNDKMEESHELARDLERSLAQASGEEYRGVKSAPFVVLIGARMPSVLAEISFVSNRADDRLLRTAAYRQRLAEGLYQGLNRYIRSLSGPGTSLASRPDPAAVK